MPILPIDDKVEVLTAPEGEEYKVIIPVVCTDDNNRCTCVTCNLNKNADDSEYQFSFGAAIYWFDDSHPPFLTQDRREVAEFLSPGAQRRRAIEAVRHGMSALLDQIAPSRVMGTSWESNPSEKCLRKYQLLIEWAQTRGYELLEQGTNSAHKRYWKMGRASH